MEYLAGIVIALIVSLFATLVGFDKERSFYPTVLVVIASYYGLFAVMGGSVQAILSSVGCGKQSAPHRSRLVRFVNSPHPTPAFGWTFVIGNSVPSGRNWPIHAQLIETSRE